MMKIKIPKKLQDYALFCAIKPSSDEYQGICGLILSGDFEIEDWQECQVVYNDNLDVILLCEEDDIKTALKDYPLASCMPASAFIKKYRSQLIKKHAE